MKDPLHLHIRKFLQTHLLANGSLNGPLLLGYSGGPDSKALLYLLLECSVEPHLVHIDHGWRQESLKEAEEVAAEAKKLKIPCTIFTLEPTLQTNLEARAREERLKCFATLYEKLGCEALLLAHHADDRAEVILKRIFEGAFLSHLEGLTPEIMLRGMRILRPLLTTPKKEVVHWLEKKKLSYFKDPTNLSPQFLRGRMRSTMLPWLEEQFGKKMGDNLCLLGQESQEIREYFAQLNQPLLSLVQAKAGESLLNLTKHLPLPSLQLKFLLKQWWDLEGASFSRSILESVANALINGKNKKFEAQGKKMIVKSGIIYLYNKLF